MQSSEKKKRERKATQDRHGSRDVLSGREGGLRGEPEEQKESRLEDAAILSVCFSFSLPLFSHTNLAFPFMP